MMQKNYLIRFCLTILAVLFTKAAFGMLALTTNQDDPNAQAINAAQNNNRRGVLEALRKGASPDAHGNEGRTLLEWAAVFGNIQLAQLLISHGASVNSTNQFNETPLHTLGTFLTRNTIGIGWLSSDDEKKLLSLTRLFFEKGAHLNRRTDRYLTPLDVVLELATTDSITRQCFDELLKLFLRHATPTFLNKRERYQDRDIPTPLQNHVTSNCLRSCQSLIDHGATIDNALIQSALVSADKSIVNLLLTYAPPTADLNIDYQLANNSIPNDSLIQLFMHGATSSLLSLNPMNPHIFTQACFFGNETFLDTTLNKCSQNSQPKDILELIPNSLHLVAARGHSHLIPVFLKRYSYLLQERDKDGNTPADIAARNGHYDCAKNLIAAGGVFNRYPLLHATIYRHDVAAASALVKENPLSVTKIDHEENTPLHLALKQPYTPMINTLLQSKCAYLYLYAYNKPTAHCFRGKTPLDLLTENPCPGDLTALAIHMFTDAFKVLAASTDNAIKGAASIIDIRKLLAQALAETYVLDIHDPAHNRYLGNVYMRMATLRNSGDQAIAKVGQSPYLCTQLVKALEPERTHYRPWLHFLTTISALRKTAKIPER